MFKHFFDPKEGWVCALTCGAFFNSFRLTCNFFLNSNKKFGKSVKKLERWSWLLFLRSACCSIGHLFYIVNQNHPDGVVVVKFKRGEDAAECIEVWISGLSNRNAAGIENSYLMRK